MTRSTITYFSGHLPEVLESCELYKGAHVNFLYLNRTNPQLYMDLRQTGKIMEMYQPLLAEAKPYLVSYDVTASWDTEEEVLVERRDWVLPDKTVFVEFNPAHQSHPWFKDNPGNIPCVLGKTVGDDAFLTFFIRQASPLARKRDSVTPLGWVAADRLMRVDVDGFLYDVPSNLGLADRDMLIQMLRGACLDIAAGELEAKLVSAPPAVNRSRERSGKPSIPPFTNLIKVAPKPSLDA
jgi:hypothetical protein